MAVARAGCKTEFFVDNSDLSAFMSPKIAFVTASVINGALTRGPNNISPVTARMWMNAVRGELKRRRTETRKDEEQGQGTKRQQLALKEAGSSVIGRAAPGDARSISGWTDSHSAHPA